MTRTQVVFLIIDVMFSVLLSAGYAQTSNLPVWTAMRLAIAVQVPFVLLASGVLAVIARVIYRRLEDPGQSEAALVRAAMALRRFPQRVVLLQVVRWVSAFSIVIALEHPTHWQPAAFFLLTMAGGPLALSLPLTDWCNAPATAELWQSMHVRGIELPVRPGSLAARLSFYSAVIVATVGAYFTSFAFAARIKHLALDEMLLSVGIFSSAALCFALLCAFAFSTTFTRPILEMSAIVARISHGELLGPIARVPLRQGDEIGALARLTNTMLARLERTAAERAGALHDLETLNQTLERRVEERTEELTRVQAVAVAHARRAGMSEVSANVLHNVGNVLNSVNVSCDALDATLRVSRAACLPRAVEMMRAQGDDLASFLATDAKGRLIPAYLLQVSEALDQDNAQVRAEVAHLKSKIHLIDTVVSAQQLYAGGRVHTERADITEIVEDILAMQAHALRESQIRVVKHVLPVEQIPIQRAKLAHVLVNLMKNAEEAMAHTASEDRVLTIEVGGAATPFIHVRDNGEGISAENLGKIFQHGFTTKPKGHGFGLHSCVSSMQEMGGKLEVKSDGLGRGSTFTLLFAAA